MQPDESDQASRDQQTLESWKEIAGYLQRDAKTARNWEKTEGLPVHRHTHKSRSSVYAYPSEIDAWRAGRRVVAEPEPPAKAYASWRPMAAGVTTLLCLTMAGDGIRPASAQQAGGRAARQVWVTRPNQDPVYSAISADARYVAFTDWETGDLGIRDLVQGTNRHLTDTGGWEKSGDYAENSVFSPDGKQVAYTWSVEHGSFLHNELRTIPIAGGSPRTVWQGQGFEDYVLPQDWSPDGAQLLVLHALPDRTSQLALLSIRDGSMRSLKSFGWQRLGASLSPDGRWIAYDSPPDAKTQARDIFMLAADGSREIPLVQNAANDSNPVWSPDASRIFFLSDRTGQEALWSLALENGQPGKIELVKADLNGAERLWMTRGGTLYYPIPGTSSPNIYTAELGSDGKISKAPALAVESFVNSNNGPSLSPNGQYLAYGSFRTPGSGRMTLVIQTRKTGEERVLNAKVPLGMAFGQGPMWFPDGRSVLVLSRIPPGPGPNFYRIDVETGNAELVHRAGAAIQGYKLSPDGRSVFYTLVDAQNSEKVSTRLVRFDIGARRETELKTGEFFIGVAVSPDSKQLAYLVQEQPGAASYLAVMPAAGGPAREIFRGSPWLDASRYNTLAWTPDQRYVLFVRGSAGGAAPNVLWRVPVAGGQAEQMGLTIPGRVKSPQIDPEGRQIFFSANESSPNEVWALENFLPQSAAAK